MKRYGRHILRYCKRAYATARSHHKDALNRYIVAHLFVAQVAGKIQGLLDGDLGDLGSASLTERQLMDLLDLGINARKGMVGTFPGLSGFGLTPVFV